MEGNKLAVKPIPSLITGMALPVIFSMLIQAVYNVVDSIFVSRISENALTAVSLAFPIQLIIVAAFVGLGTGLNSNISRRLGEGKPEKARLYCEHGVLMALVLSLIVALIGLVLSRPYFTWFTQVDDIINQGSIYVFIVTVFSVFRITAHAGASSMQGTGDMIPPMFAQLIGAIGNIILDPILIFGWFGLPAMGVKGAAIATVTAQALSMFYIWVVIFKKQNVITPKRHSFKFSTSISADILKVGVPSAIMQGLGSVMLAGINLILSQFGETALAVMGAYFKVQSMVYMPIFGLAIGTMPVVGFNFGAHQRDRIKKAIIFSSSVAVGFMSLCLLIFQVFPKPLLGMFAATDLMFILGIDTFKIMSLMFPMVAITIILSSSFNAMGKAHYSLIISVIRQLVVLLPVAYVLASLVGINGVWYAFIIAETIGVLLTLTLFIRTYIKV